MLLRHLSIIPTDRISNLQRVAIVVPDRKYLQSIVPPPVNLSNIHQLKLPCPCIAVASRNCKASWTSAGWASSREAKAWSSGGRSLAVFFMLAPGLGTASLITRGGCPRCPKVGLGERSKPQTRCYLPCSQKRGQGLQSWQGLRLPPICCCAQVSSSVRSNEHILM